MGTYSQVEPAQIACVVQQQYARFHGRPIRDFVPLFVERNVTKELAKLLS
ncbi:three-helix bundle dimerization domain-containing protein [Mycolicibacterium sp. BiH015]